MQELRPAVRAAAGLAAPSCAALSNLTWFIDMSRRLEQREIHMPNFPERLCLARLEGLPHGGEAMIRPGFGWHYFLNAKLKLHQLSQFSFSPPIPGQKVH